MIARWVRRFAVPIILGWVILAAALNILVPQLEKTIEGNSPPFVGTDTESSNVMELMGKRFGDSTTNNTVYLLLEGDEALGSTAREYYNEIVGKLRDHPELVTSVNDLWNDPVAASGNESSDHKAVYAQVWLAGMMGTSTSLEAIDLVREIVAETPAPPGVSGYIAGMGATVTDELRAADRDTFIISGITFVVIFILLLLVYRSLVTAILPLISVGLALAIARAIASWLGAEHVIDVSMFASALPAALILGAGTDYSIFLIGRYHENRNHGVSREDSYYAAYRGVNHIVVASALTIAGACACLGLTQIVMIRSAGIPSAIGMMVALAAALTLTPALVTVASNRGYLDPRVGTRRDRTWRRFGTAVVRWPVPCLAAALAPLVLLIAVLPTITLNFSETEMQPEDSPSNLALAAADRHFPPNQLLGEFVLIDADHDLRTPQDAIAIEAVSAAIAKIPDVHTVQSISRPTGALLPDAMLTSQAGTVGAQMEQSNALLTARLKDVERMEAGLTSMLTAIDTMTAGLSGANSSLAGAESGAAQAQAGMEQLQGSVDEIVSVLDPLRAFVGQNPRCATDPLCAAANAIVSGYDASPIPAGLAGLDQVAQGTGALGGATGAIGTSLEATAESMAGMRASIAAMLETTKTVGATMDLLVPSLGEATGFLQEVGKNFGGSENGVFYMPQQAFDDPRLGVAMRNLFSPDGKATRILVFGTEPALSQAGIDRAKEIKAVARQALRGTSLEGSAVRVSGIGSAFVDIEQITVRDLKLVATVTFIFVFLVVLVVIRSLVAAITVVTTVALSYLSAIGLSVLVWQHLLGHEVYWAVPTFAFIALVAVGSDYNLLFTARIREEVHGGHRTGIIRAFAGTGSVVTTAGLVFSITMFAMLGSSLLNIMQIGSTVGLGLLVDTFIIRAVVVPAIASITKAWFWWPIPPRLLRPAREKAPREKAQCEKAGV